MKSTDPVFPTTMQCMGLDTKAILGREIGSQPHKFIVAEALQATKALLKELE